MAWNAWEHIRVLIETYWNVNFAYKDVGVIIFKY